MKKFIVTLLLVLPFCVPSQISAQNDLSKCRVAKNSGIYTFTDSEPVSDYEIIGEVSVTGYESRELQESGGQYQNVRDELIKTAKAANGQVEGVILTLITGSPDKAHLIKFKNPEEDHSIARAKRYSGIYIFCDSDPISQYEYLGDLRVQYATTIQYSNMRDAFIKKCMKKYKDAKGIVLHLVSGGKDSAEAIRFEK